MERATATGTVSRRILIAVVVCACIVVVVRLWPIVGRPVGDGPDGQNLGLWGSLARNLLRVGPRASHMGLQSPNISDAPYIDHPPLLPWLLAAAWSVTGVRPGVARGLIVLLGSIPATIGLCGTVRAVTRSTWATASATMAFALSRAMVSFGAMVDTWTLGLGPALLFTWLLVDPMALSHARRRAAIGVLAAASVMLSWLGFAMVGLACLAAIHRRWRRLSVVGDQTMVIAAVAAAAVVASVLGTVGSQSGLLHVVGSRTGKSDALAAARFSWESFTDLLGPVGVAGCAVVLACLLLTPASTRGLRPLFGACAVWSGFLDGGSIPFWHYWWAAVGCIGLGLAVHHALRVEARATYRWLAAGALSVAALGGMRTNSEDQVFLARWGASVGVRAWPEAQPTAWILSRPQFVSWVEFDADRRAETVSVTQLRALASSRPLDAVAVTPNGVHPGLCVGRSNHLIVVPIAEAVAALDGREIRACAT